ncbi:MAG: DUF1819 family protein [Chloroflexi bacterium]|nr:DUF1819 family protein [Chloroflexota bacterium]
MTAGKYTTRLGSGQGIVQETFILLDLWNRGMNVASLYQFALQSGRFQRLTARRLRNLVAEGFASRFLGDGTPAVYLKALKQTLNGKEFVQLLFLYTCRANRILYDFVQEVYWNAYSSGRATLSNEESTEFVVRANQEGKTTSPWSKNMIERVAGYLTGTLADLSLLEDGSKRARKILPYRMESRVAIFLAYDLHFAGNGDNAVLSHTDWALFGMDRSDVLDELKRQALRGWLIVQSAGDATRIGWQYRTMEELTDAFVKG